MATQTGQRTDAATQGGRPFGDLLTKWLAHIAKRGLSPKTVDEARREIENRIRPLLGDIPVSDLTAEKLDDAYYAWLGEGLSASSVHLHAAVVSAALTQGFKWGWIDSNPAAVSPTGTGQDEGRGRHAPAGVEGAPQGAG